MFGTQQRYNLEKEKPLFSRTEIPSEAEPVQFAQSLFVLSLLGFFALSVVFDGTISWIFPVSIPFAGYYAYTIHRTGYAVGQNIFYSRDENPFIYNVHLAALIGYILLAALAPVF